MGSHGVYGIRFGAPGDVIITFSGGVITAEGTDAHGISSLATDGVNTVYVGGRVIGGTGLGAGVGIDGGGSVTVGPNGFLTSGRTTAGRGPCWGDG